CPGGGLTESTGGGALHYRKQNADDCWIFGPGDVTYQQSPVLAHDRTVPHLGVQARRAGRPSRTQDVRAPFHAVSGSWVRGNAPGNRTGEYATRAAARYHEIHHRERGALGQGCNQRAALDGGSEGARAEHVSNPDEPTGE